MTFNPDPKPVKREKVIITSSEFRKKYGQSVIKSNKPAKKLMKKRLYNYPVWTWFSRFIKVLHANNEGLVKCATSGALFHVSSPNLHAGHCIKVYDGNNTNLSVALDYRNVLPQSSKDNVYSGGKPEIMRDKINQIFGEGTYSELVRLSKQPKYYSEGDYKAKAVLFRERTYKLLQDKGIRKWW